MRIVLRLLAAGLLVGGVAATCADALVDRALPLVALGARSLGPDFRLLRLARELDGGESVLRAEVTLSRPVTVGTRTFRPDPRGRAGVRTPAGAVLVIPAIVAALVLAWPASGARERLVRLAAAGLLVSCAVPLDVGAVLVDAVWALFPGGAGGALGAWATFVQGGGRFAVAIGLAAAAIGAGRWSPAGVPPGAARPCSDRHRPR